MKMSEQEVRASLRENFLRSISKFSGENCKILTYEESTLSGTFGVWKPDGTEIIVKDLKTPANVKVDRAVLRTPDIVELEFDNVNL